MPTKEEIRDAILDQSLRDLRRDAIVLIPSVTGAVIIAQNRVIPYVYDENDVEGLRDLHFDLDELLWVVVDSYAERVVRHYIEHGRKYDCHDPNCEICHGRL